MRASSLGEAVTVEYCWVNDENLVRNAHDNGAGEDADFIADGQ